MVSTAPIERAQSYRARSGSRESLVQARLFSLLRIGIENAPDHGDDILRRHIVPFNLDITV